MGLIPVCQMNKNFNKTAGEVAHKSYLSSTVRTKDITMEAYNNIAIKLLKQVVMQLLILPLNKYYLLHLLNTKVYKNITKLDKTTLST